LSVAIEQFNAASTAQTTELVKLTKEAGRQTDTMVSMTKWIIALTVILAILATPPMIIALRDLWRILRGA
jgi:hypothetical protein